MKKVDTIVFKKHFNQEELKKYRVILEDIGYYVTTTYDRDMKILSFDIYK